MTPPAGLDAVARVRWWLDNLAGRIADERGVPRDICGAVMLQESGGQEKVESPMNYTQNLCIGRAQGLMQVMPLHFGVDVPLTGELTDAQKAYCQDPEINVSRGCEILAHNYRVYGDWKNAVAAYFGWGTDATGATTAQYVAAVMALRDYFV